MIQTVTLSQKNLHNLSDKKNWQILYLSLSLVHPLRVALRVRGSIDCRWVSRPRRLKKSGCSAGDCSVTEDRNPGDLKIRKKTSMAMQKKLEGMKKGDLSRSDI